MDTSPSRPLPPISVILAIFGLALALVRLDRPTVGLGAPLVCERAQVVDGELRCDAEVVGDLRDLCGGGWSRSIEPGDEVRGACTGAVVDRMPPEQLAALEQPVDVNRASVEEIASLPGIGPTIAARIVAGRPYASVEELLEVEGIGVKRLEGMRRRVRVGR